MLNLTKSMINVKKRKVKYLRSSFNENRIKTLYHEQKGKCYYCKCNVYIKNPKNPNHLATIEHKLPISRGGNNSKKNIVIACYLCNNKKGNLTELEFLNSFTSDIVG